MPKEILKVKGKHRLFDDIEVGVTYQVKAEAKTGKKGEPSYEKIAVTIESGSSAFYNSVPDRGSLIVEYVTTQKGLDEFQQEKLET